MSYKFSVFAIILFVATFGFAENTKDTHRKQFYPPNIQNKIAVFKEEVHKFKAQETLDNIETTQFPGQHAFCEHMCSNGAVDPSWADYIRCYLACMSIK